MDFSHFSRNQPQRGDEDISSFMQRLDLDQVLSILGMEVGPNPRAVRSCPLHQPDRNPSFSFFRSAKDGRWLWKCHASCGHGDLLDLVVKMTGLSKGDALAMLRKSVRGPMVRPSLRAPSMSMDAPAPERPKPSLTLDVGTDAEIAALAKLRGFQERGLRLASERGLLRFANYMGERCWVTTDSERAAMACRPLASRKFKNGEQSKVVNVPKTNNNHLQGGADVPKYNVQFIAEGGPDLLSAHDVILELDDSGIVSTKYAAASGLLSATSTLSSEVCMRFADQKVVVFAHADEPGEHCADRLAGQLRPYAEYVYVIPCSSMHPDCKDLLDLMLHWDGRVKLLASLDRLFRDGTPPRI